MPRRAVLFVVAGTLLLGIVVAGKWALTPSSQRPAVAAATTTVAPPTTTVAPKPPAETFTAASAVAAMKRIWTERQHAFQTVDPAELKRIYTSYCNCLARDTSTLTYMRSRRLHLQGLQLIKSVKFVALEASTRTAIVHMTNYAGPEAYVDSAGHVVEGFPGTSTVVSQVNLAWDGHRWAEAHVDIWSRS